MRLLHLFPILSFTFVIACTGEDVAGLDAGTKDSGGGGATGEAMLSADTVDLGAVVVGTTDAADFTITNPGGESVTVALSPVAGPNGERFERKVNIPEDAGVFTLEAGGVATVTIEASPTEAGPLLGVVVVDSCAGTCPQPVVLLADGAPSGLDCPAMVDLGKSNPGSCVTQAVTCTNLGNATERVTAVELDPASAAELTIVEPALPASLAPNDTLAVDVTYCPDDVADHTGELVVFTFEPFETEQRIALSGSGGGADVTCAPTTLDYGMVGVGASVSAFVICDNTGFEDAVLSGSVSDAEFTVATSSITIATGESGAFEVVLTPTSPGAKQSSLTITTNDPDLPTVDVSLTANALMIGPCTATVQPGAIDFGLSGLGEEREGVIIVQNTGSEPCLFRGASLLPDSDPNFGVRDAPAAGTAVQPGERIKITATFSPETTMPVQGTVDVSFANPNTPALQVLVEASGGTQPLDIQPPVIDLGDVAVGCATPARQTVRLRRVLPGMSSVVNASIVQMGTDFGVENSGVPAQLGFYDEITLDVVFTPSATGFASAALRLVTGSSPTPVFVPIVARAVTDVARTDTVTLTPPKLDILFVVDDSCSMADAQAALADAADAVTDAITNSNADVHIGVITTDMDAQTRSGRLIGDPAVLDGNTPNLLSVLEGRFVPGITGSGDEQGIAATVAAVTSPLADNENAGFLRDDADLAIFVLSDENDFSPGSPTISTHVRALRLAARSGRLHMAGIVGPARGADCTGPYGLGQVGDRYAEFIGRVGNYGQLLSYCENMRSNLEAVMQGFVGGASFELSTRPVITTVGVSVNGGALDASAFAYEAIGNRVVINDASTVPAGATVTITYDSHCVSGTCGDGTTDAGEQCDDMNTVATDQCIECFDAVCGDGFVDQANEECDDGNLVASDDCLPACTVARCGDGVLQLGVEECDDNNTIGGDGCPANCRFYVAGALQAQPFVELTNGSTLTFAGGNDPLDDGTATITMPFAFSFYDMPVTELTVSVNGFLSMATFAVADSFENDPIPSTNNPNAIIAAWWTDLQMDEDIPGGADVSWEVQGTAPDRVLTVQWRDIRAQDHSTAGHRRFSFQIALSETSSNIEIRYGDTETRAQVPTAVDASGGIEDSTGATGIEALGCSPTCDGRPRSAQRTNGFPEQSAIAFTP